MIGVPLRVDDNPQDYVKKTSCTIHLKANNTTEQFALPVRAKIDGKIDGDQTRQLTLSLVTTTEKHAKMELHSKIDVCFIEFLLTRLLYYTRIIDISWQSLTVPIYKDYFYI